MARKESAELLRALRLLERGQAKSISEAARMAGVNRSTIQRAQNRRGQRGRVRPAIIDNNN